MTLIEGLFEDNLHFAIRSSENPVIVTDPPLELEKKKWKILFEYDIPIIVFAGLKGADSLRRKICMIEDVSGRSLTSWYSHGGLVSSLAYNETPAFSPRMEMAKLHHRYYIPHDGHPASLPTAYVYDALWHASSHINIMDSTIIDPFMGVGTTLEAADLIGISSIGIERDQEYFKLAQERLGREDDGE